MLLSKYVEEIVKSPRHVTKSILQIDTNVVNRIREARDLSEDAIRELGMMIYWMPKSRRLLCGKVIAGARTVVDWDGTGFTARDYVGTVHTHPYLKKLGPEAEIGFSFQDFDFYAGNFPLWMPLGINFVVSNERLFLAVFRDVTQKTISDALFRRLNSDELEADRYLRRQGISEQRTNELTEQISSLQSQNRLAESARVERDFYRNVRGYLKVRLLANRAMIANCAQALRFEAYEGRLGGNLNLQSAKVYLR